MHYAAGTTPPPECTATQTHVTFRHKATDNTSRKHDPVTRTYEGNKEEEA